MSGYGSWGVPKGREAGDFHERAFRRKGLAEWDAKWHALSPGARTVFVNTLKGPARNQADHAPTPAYTVPKDGLPAAVVEELTAAGFVGVLPARSKKGSDRVFARARVYDFAARVRMLRRLHLLAGDQPAGLVTYTTQVFQTYELIDVLRGVLGKAGMDNHDGLDLLLGRYVKNYRWPAWVSKTLKDPMADRVIKAAFEAGGPIPLVELPGRVEGADPEKVRAAVNKLIARLVLFEDLDPATSDIVIDFLPAVREGLARAGRPRGRPPLVACEQPREVGPDDGPIVEDLRPFLLEVAAEPPRLRQGKDLFQKELERFRAGLPPLPSWLLELLDWTDETRMGRAIAWARAASGWWRSSTRGRSSGSGSPPRAVAGELVPGS